MQILFDQPIELSGAQGAATFLVNDAVGDQRQKSGTFTRTGNTLNGVMANLVTGSGTPARAIYTGTWIRDVLGRQAAPFTVPVTVV